MRTQNKEGFRRVEILVIDSSAVPDELWDQVIEKCDGYRYMHYLSEFSPGDENDHWGNHLSIEKLEKYWKDQCKISNYTGTLPQFIKSYGLEVDKWLIETGYDFTGVKEIFFETC